MAENDQIYTKNDLKAIKFLFGGYVMPRIKELYPKTHIKSHHNVLSDYTNFTQHFFIKKFNQLLNNEIQL